MQTKKLEQDILKIKERNRRVELDKAWETSLTRKITILILTYIVIVIVFIVIGLPSPFLNAIIPAIAFVLSTLTLDPIKKIWMKYKKL
ncbi:MAG: hypothetical protein WCF78_04430 [archaeon]